MAKCNFKFKAISRLMCRYFILISHVDSTDETRRLLLKVYNKKVIECILRNIRHEFIWRRTHSQARASFAI